MPTQWTTDLPETSNPVTLECDCYVHQFGAIAPRRRESYYETDMSDAEWALVRALMPMPAWMESRGGCPEAYCHRDMEDEAGFTHRPPRGRTWGRRGHTPQVTVSGRRSGRLSVAGMIAMRPGSRTRLCHRLRTHLEPVAYECFEPVEGDDGEVRSDRSRAATAL
ncbi:hypothetical protein OG889_40415 [Streptomyces sp. NBC_00481]|nr:hypothetical protein [Streptomyces sp. NBC_00481]WRZ00401.1 hypothetical protein OG889_40415 [Streptomyces sp. NBC_00481]